MKEGDLVYIAGREDYTFTTRGSWGYFLKYFGDNNTACVHWKHFACDQMDRDHFVNGRNGSDEQRRWVAFARERGEPLSWEEVCAAWQTNHKITQQDIEQFMGEIVFD